MPKPKKPDLGTVAMRIAEARTAHGRSKETIDYLRRIAESTTEDHTLARKAMQSQVIEPACVVSNAIESILIELIAEGGGA